MFIFIVIMYLKILILLSRQNKYATWIKTFIT